MPCTGWTTHNSTVQHTVCPRIYHYLMSPVRLFLLLLLLLLLLLYQPIQNGPLLRSCAQEHMAQAARLLQR